MGCSLSRSCEGRLVLADAMWYAQERYKPHTLIDLATLTGAMIVQRKVPRSCAAPLSESCANGRGAARGRLGSASEL